MKNGTKYKINKEIGIDIKTPKEKKLKSFQNFFTFLRKSLQIKYTRKIHIDSLLKKCKGKFFKAVYDCLKKCLKICIKKPPQVFITNISIKYNKPFLDFTLYNLYQYFNLNPYPMEFIIKKKYCKEGKEDFFKYIFLSKIDKLYSAYIESNRYKKEIELIKKRKGIKIAFLYQFVAENFISYYSYSKPNMKRIKMFQVIKENINNTTNKNNNIIKKQNENTNTNSNNNGNINSKDKDTNKINIK